MTIKRIMYEQDDLVDQDQAVEKNKLKKVTDDAK